jgi:PAS domain S-box-containing protein
MAESLFPFAYLHDARLASLATVAAPAWLWRSDGGGLLWANAAAADLFDSVAPATLARSPCLADSPMAGEIARLAGGLPANGSPRLAALTVPREGAEHRPLCLCSRLTLDDGTTAVLAVATESIGAPLPHDERVRRLLADTDAPVAAFAADGRLIHGTEAATGRMGGLTTLASLGAGDLAAQAIAGGHAEGLTPLGTLRVDRIGRDGAIVLLTTFPSGHAESAKAAAGEPPPEAEHAIAEPAAPAEPVDPPAEADPSPSPPEAPAERQPPLRFAWQINSEGRFTVASDAFVALIGPDNAAILGQPWIDVARQLNLDPEDHISRAIDARETWSGITVSWPVAGSDERLPVEMSGLPMFDRDRAFLGYRGFGVCRDAGRHAALQAEAPALSAVEHTAFRELARQLSARLKGEPVSEAAGGEDADRDAAGAAESRPHSTGGETATTQQQSDGARELMDRLPVGVLVYRINTPVYANRAFLKWSGDADLDAFSASGGLDRLFVESGVSGERENEPRQLTLTTGAGSGLAQSRLFAITWEGERAHALAIVPAAADQAAAEADLRKARRQLRELRSIVDVSTDGIAVLDGEGRIIQLNHKAEGLFGRPSAAVKGRPLAELLMLESRGEATAAFKSFVGNAEARHGGLEVVGRRGDAGSMPLFMTLGRLAVEKPKFCAVFRDISPWKRTEQDLRTAKRQAEQASQAKSDFLAKISHEIRTPLNAIIGFSEVMMEERLGPVENERYRAYLKDIHASGDHLVGLLSDLLDLSKIEAGKLDLRFDSVNLNELTQQCVALMQPQANRGRVIIRTSLAPTLPPIVADARSVRQILLNLLSNSIKFTGAGGQVIVSTAPTEGEEAVLRVRDTGIGMSEKEIEIALEPFRQIETSARGGSGGTGLGLPLTKALAEANRATFAIKSTLNSGTLVEIAFPAAAVGSQ